MAKHPVPKKKTSKGRTNRRYKAFQNSARAKLANMTQLVKCQNCGAMAVQHQACKECGMYRGLDVMGKVAKQAAKVTVVKAE